MRICESCVRETCYFFFLEMPQKPDQQYNTSSRQTAGERNMRAVKGWRERVERRWELVLAKNRFNQIDRSRNTNKTTHHSSTAVP